MPRPQAVGCSIDLRLLVSDPAAEGVLRRQLLEQIDREQHTSTPQGPGPAGGGASPA